MSLLGLMGSGRLGVLVRSCLVDMESCCSMRCLGAVLAGHVGVDLSHLVVEVVDGTMDFEDRCRPCLNGQRGCWSVQHVSVRRELPRSGHGAVAQVIR
jgi:hypothetical protein